MPLILAVSGEAPDPEVVARALAVLREGALLIYPTDTLYALGCRAQDALAVERLRAAKGRPSAQPLPVIAADLGQARRLASSWPPAAERAARHFWPGPLSLVLRAQGEVPGAVTAGTGTVAV